MSGQIDRLVVEDDRVLIVDYKTMRPVPASEDEVAPIYLRQLAIYREALARIYPGRDIRCALLWTQGPLLMPISPREARGAARLDGAFSPPLMSGRILRRTIAMKPTAVTDSNFDTEVLGAEGPVLVDFWAEWCGPCKMIAPFLEDLAADKAGKLTVAKVNIDENPQSPTKYGVRGIPTMILFKGGKVAATKIGALPKSKLYEWINSVL